MIIIKLQGGLGNQLFQYTFGRFLELVHNRDVAYDDTFFRTEHRFTKRSYALHLFATKVRIATDDEIRQAKYPLGLVSVAWFFFKKAFNKYVTKRYAIGYDKRIPGSATDSRSVFLEGWWQTHLYADKIRDRLLDELCLRDHPSPAYRRFVDMMQASPSVFVHVRRGDYLTSTGLEVLKKDYYAQARSFMESRVVNPVYFIFSDDSAWARENMKELFGRVEFVDDTTLSDEQVFMLMSKCKHGIIANSSFSWWGAYLIQHPGKIIIAPKSWQNIYLATSDDLCPQEWIRM